MVLKEPITALVPVKPEKESAVVVKGQEIQAMEAKTISKFAEASTLELTEREKSILFAPIDVNDILTRPVGGGKLELYLEWSWYAERLDAAFGPGDWAITPASWNPRISVMGNKVVGEYILWIRGRYARRAFGVHEETRANADFGDAAEATEAEALKRCCKKLGIARDLWRKRKIEEFKVLLKQKGNSGGGESKPGPQETTLHTSTSLEAAAQQSSTIKVIKENMANCQTLAELKEYFAEVWKNRKVFSEQELLQLEAFKNEMKEKF